jgi:hypothetical protein
MDISIDIFGAIVLNNPVHSRKINTSGSNISTKEDSIFPLYEFKVNSCSLGLFLSSMKLKKINSNFQSLEGFECKSYFFTS